MKNSKKKKLNFGRKIVAYLHLQIYPNLHPKQLLPLEFQAASLTVHKVQTEYPNMVRNIRQSLSFSNLLH